MSEAAPRTDRNPLGPFLQHLLDLWPRVASAMVLAWCVTALNLALPYQYKELGNGLFTDASGSHDEIKARTLLFMSRIGVVLAILMTRRVCQSFAAFMAMSVTQRVAVAARRQVYEHLHRLRLEFFDDQRTGALVSNVTNDVTTIQYLLHDGMVEIFSAPLVVAGSIVLVFRIDFELGLLAFGVFPALYLILRMASGRLRRLSQINQATLSSLTTMFLETVANIRIVRAFCRQSYETDRFLKANKLTLDARMRNARLSIGLEFLAEMVQLLGFAGVLYLGGSHIIAGKIKGGDLLAMVAYLSMMRTSINSLSTSFTRYQQAVGAADRLLALLREPPVEVPPAMAMEAGHEWRGRLTLDHVHFGYPDGTEVLRGATVDIAPGEKVALIGESGVGKSTVASVLLGLYRQQSGTISIDGVNTLDLPPEQLLELVSVVPQEVGLFSGTVRENIAYARLDATDEEIAAAALAANAHEFIGRMPEGYNTFVGDQGVKMSGGQRQRIAIARAILRNPRILILDEATSHVDAQTAELVQEALARLMSGRTVLIIAHHASALRGVDRVLALRAGRFEELTTAEGLLHQ